VAGTRAKFDARLTATSFFQTADIPVRVKGVGFFDFEHGQTGIAPNGIELHPVLDIDFIANTSTMLMSDANPSQFGQPIAITATVTNGGTETPTGSVIFVEGGVSVGSGVLDQNGRATFASSALSAGSHSVTASYEGDRFSAPSTSAPLAQIVDKADQTIAFAVLPDKTYGDPPFTVNAGGGGSDNPVTFIAGGNCSSTGPNGATIAITSAGVCTVTASQAGNSNYSVASEVSRNLMINQSAGSIIVNGYSDMYDGKAHGAAGSATGVNSEDLTGLMDFGARFTDVPGGTAVWTFAGDADYGTAAGSASIVIGKATPSFSNLSAAGITDRTTSANLSGRLSLVSLIPTGRVAITLDGVTQYATIQADGSFSSSFGTSSLTPSRSPYGIVYRYAGNRNFNSTIGSGTVTVQDTTPPVIQSATPSPSIVWPPNRSMVPVTIAVSASDAVDPAPACRVARIAGNDGATPADWEITGPASVSLRADRTGRGSGRNYQITVACTDAAGNAATSVATVRVPHEAGK
jgi:hypothetical protein